MAEDNSICKGHLVSFSSPGEAVSTDTVECDYIENIVLKEVPGGYTILFRGGEALESDDRVQLKVLKPYATEVCACACACVVLLCCCDVVCVCVCVHKLVIVHVFVCRLC